MQLTMSNFDVKKNCFLKKNSAGPIGREFPVFAGEISLGGENNTDRQNRYIVLLFYPIYNISPNGRFPRET
jgi:hypothetical protein